MGVTRLADLYAKSGLTMADSNHHNHESRHGLALDEDRFRALFEFTPMLCFTVTYNGRIQSVNRYAEQTLGIEASALIGRDFIQLHPEDAQQVRDGLDRIIQQPGTVARWETRLGYAHDDLPWVRAIACDAGPVGPVGPVPTILILCETLVDNHHLPELAYHVNHDPLTGLFNRREFERRANQLIEDAQNEHATHVMGFVDLDQFKIVNDTAGHLAGDTLLRYIASMLRSHTRDSDTVARVGGDEFGLLLSHCRIGDARQIAEQVLADMQPLPAHDTDGGALVGMSIGLAAITKKSTDLNEVLRAAEAACYQAKSQGGDRSYVYCSRDVALTRRQHEFQWVSRIKLALKEQRLALVYQPIVSLAAAARADSGVALGACELLVRLVEPDGRVVTAGEFLPVAENYGLASRLDQWVINRAFDWLRDRPSMAEALDICAINLSAQSLNDEQCVSLLCARLTDGSVSPDKICLEITETAGIRYLDGALRSIETIRGLGAHFALDDFGSGLASFAYLKTLPADFIKIDASLMAGLGDNNVNRAIVTFINDIAHHMGKQTIAEGVEDRAIFPILDAIGVDFVQGYALGRPRPLAELD